MSELLRPRDVGSMDVAVGFGLGSSSAAATWVVLGSSKRGKKEMALLPVRRARLIASLDFRVR